MDEIIELTDVDGKVVRIPLALLVHTLGEHFAKTGTSPVSYGTLGGVVVSITVEQPDPASAPS